MVPKKEIYFQVLGHIVASLVLATFIATPQVHGEVLSASGSIPIASPVKQIQLFLTVAPITGEVSWTAESAKNKVLESVTVRVGVDANIAPFADNQTVEYGGDEGGSQTDEIKDMRFELKVTQASYQPTSEDREDSKKLVATIQVVDLGKNLSELLKSRNYVTLVVTYGDEEVEIIAEVAAIYPNETPKEINVSGAYESIQVSWAIPGESVVHLDLTENQTVEKKVSEVGVWLLESTGSDLSLVGRQALVDVRSPSSEKAACSLILESNNCSINCKSGEHYYLTFNENSKYFSKINADSGSLAIGNLQTKLGSDPNQFAVVVSYLNGLQYQCFLASPKINFTLTEINGFDDRVKRDNPNCFIATAAYGHGVHEDLDLLRWFRDEFLLTSKMGRDFVANYYRYSPPVARWIDANEGAKASVRLGLILPILAISTLQYVYSADMAAIGFAGTLVLAMIFGGVFYFWRRPRIH